MKKKTIIKVPPIPKGYKLVKLPPQQETEKGIRPSSHPKRNYIHLYENDESMGSLGITSNT